MKKIKYENAKRDNTLYRIKTGGRYESVIITTDGRLIYSTIRPDTNMAIIVGLPDGTPVSTI